MKEEKPSVRGLKGHYGFLTDYEKKTKEEAQHIIDNLWEMGIHEFQFYDWFSGYSTPVGHFQDNEKSVYWNSPWDESKRIYRDTIIHYTERIKAKHGRAWAYVQGVGAEEDNLASAKISPILSNNADHITHGGKFYLYYASKAWAERMIEVWLKDIKKLGFTGIHWDMLTRERSKYDLAEIKSFYKFLAHTHAVLNKQIPKLEQTTNMVSLAYWNKGIIQKYLAFPYVEVWSEDEKNRYYEKLSNVYSNLGKGLKEAPLKGVVAYYPGKDRKDEETLSFIKSEFIQAKKNNASFLTAGNNYEQLETCYFPETKSLHHEIRTMFLWQKFENEGKGESIRLSITRENKKYYIASKENGEVHVKSNGSDNYSLFVIAFYANNNISLKIDADNGCYLTVGEKERSVVCENKVHAKYDHDSDWQRFRITLFGNNIIALRGVNGNYLSAKDGGGGELIAECKNADMWEKFTYEVSVKPGRALGVFQ